MIMVYKEFQDLKLSALGMGAMRLPVINGRDADIDEEKTAEMVAYAMEQGVNYYDTAWGYHNGNSELVMGRALNKYPREKYYLATKFPGYDLSNMDKVEEIFERQLEKCGVTYFDFYLFHNVCEMNIDAYLDEKYHIFDYLMEQKEKGRIHHLGFSAHGNCDGDAPFPGGLWRAYGVLPDSVELAGLVFSGCESKSRAALGVQDSRVGDGAAARRKTVQFAERRSR